MPLVYVFLGASGSGRREVLADLVKSGLEATEDRAVVLVAQNEVSTDADAQLSALSNAQVLPWTPDEGQEGIPELPEAATHVFFVVDGQRDPIDQLELIRDWIAEREDMEMARIITVVHSRLAFEKPGLRVWFDACIHFSDAVLFHQRQEVPNKWFRDFEQRFKAEFYPAVFEFVKGGRVRNPAEILYPEPRRLSQAFDFEDEDESLDGVEFVDAIVDEDDIAGEAYDPDEDVDARDLDDEDEGPVSEPYFERNEAGRRVRQLPDIRNFL